ncbi:aspartate--tRNA ligase [Cyclobacterium marinum]|uniref:Aspartate--tRNA ligase n=1 Tax=Cyclobacterium marinum (strain ATCC 25205 / DSM 745 / LMG 13164 / NCIMB 1802) TaxID=880070 RepID=G0J0X1_CYCMS|nr:aspartate--tRNA ligase [Cyclobacterium marinum]AEL25097.1 aspartyl-tRNA synthetase [Cyclobacterium marinum DSM 745]MBI0401432.1 aspartate--tRNA ligase [Cyclobacterium marinum]MBR9776204.1 aspartate--tRNA ligase [Cytophagales bacterium]|tara:strand:- start:86437 stop:88191 length:1755 start_codon:yes stop_codon:yes gene_type:complete
MLRTHTCGELRLEDLDKKVILSGWVQRVRNKGGLAWVDLRDRYGVTQLIFEEGAVAPELLKTATTLGREYVVQAEGVVIERASKNDKIPTGSIEIRVSELKILNKAKVPPFIIEDETDGGEELRMKYRYLDLRRNVVREKLQLRHRMMQETRKYMDGQDFMEVETPVLIKSTPEGARDFVVPSRVHGGEFYALPQSPQTFKQLLMVSGFDRYFQIVKCFRDEDLRADRQPEFTQIDCEMSFVDQEDILEIFEGLVRHLFTKVKGMELGEIERMTYEDAMRLYGNDKPDIRFGMPFVELNDLAQGKGFSIFDSAELILGINAEGAANYTRKQLDALTNWVKRPQIGAKGLVYVKCNEDGSFKSSVDKFYSQEDLKAWAEKAGAKKGDLILVLSGSEKDTRKQMSELRLKMGDELGLRDKSVYRPLWVLDFPLLEWDEETARYHAMHHPFTSPKKEDMELLDKDPGKVRANAYDLVINGVEIGGGSIRIHDKETQQMMFRHLGFTEEEAQSQFGFLMEAFEFGAPPHGGIAFGFDRLCAIFGGTDSIRDYIAFPKNNAGRDVMINSPSSISDEQLVELSLDIKLKE